MLDSKKYISQLKSINLSQRYNSLNYFYIFCFSIHKQVCFVELHKQTPLIFQLCIGFCWHSVLQNMYNTYRYIKQVSNSSTFSSHGFLLLGKSKHFTLKTRATMQRFLLRIRIDYISSIIAFLWWFPIKCRKKMVNFFLSHLKF